MIFIVDGPKLVYLLVKQCDAGQSLIFRDVTIAVSSCGPKHVCLPVKETIITDEWYKIAIIRNLNSSLSEKVSFHVINDISK